MKAHYPIQCSFKDIQECLNVAYEFYLYPLLACVNHVFHIFMPKKSLGDHALIVDNKIIGIKENISYE